MKKILFFSLCVLTLIGCDPKDPSGSSLSTNPNFNPMGFSINDTTKVYFSQGNLQYCPFKRSWRFATNQTDTLGDRNELISDTYDGWIDLFSWGTGENPTSTSGSDEFKDWGKNRIVNGGNYEWFTLSQSEWEYVLFRRSHTSFRALINGQRGVIILPDEFIRPDSVYYEESNNKKQWSLPANRLSVEEWAKMEANGAVFLPMTGRRDGLNYIRGNKLGTYWSRTSDPDDPSDAYEFNMKEEYSSKDKEYHYSHYANKTLPKYYGVGVRLVRRIQ